MEAIRAERRQRAKSFTKGSIIALLVAGIMVCLFFAPVLLLSRWLLPGFIAISTILKSCAILVGAILMILYYVGMQDIGYFHFCFCRILPAKQAVRVVLRDPQGQDRQFFVCLGCRRIHPRISKRTQVTEFFKRVATHSPYRFISDSEHGPWRRVEVGPLWDAQDLFLIPPTSRVITDFER